MADDQILIKALLIGVFAIFAIILVIPVTGARRLAVRRLTLALAFVAAIVAVALPELVNEFANFLGVGRGTDLVLYALVVVFIGNTIYVSAHHRQMQREITLLARRLALMGAAESDADRDVKS